jgi:hypothetical protein
MYLQDHQFVTSQTLTTTLRTKILYGLISEVYTKTSIQKGTNIKK